MKDYIEQFKDAIRAAGITPPEVVEADGQIHRYSTNGKPDDEAGWYILYCDGIPAGSFGDWRTVVAENWKADIGRNLTREEKAAQTKKLEILKLQREEEKKNRNREAREEAERIWKAAKPALADHPYLNKKSVKTYGLRVHDGRLVVPMRDEAGTLHSLQFIGPDGDKRFFTGGKVKGCYHAFGGDPGKAGALCIVEGYATGASIHEATGYPVAVAFNAGNLESVAKSLRTKFPEARIILCADDDNRTEGNPGITKATEAARGVIGLLAIPAFGDNRPEGKSDFNDLHQFKGLEAVKECIEVAQIPPMQAPSPPQENPLQGNIESQNEGNGAWSRLKVINAMDFMALEFPPRENILAPWLSKQGLAMVHAPRGIGKTHFSLGVAYAVASGGKLFGWEAPKSRGVLFLDGEMPAVVLQERLAKIAGSSDRDLTAPFHIVTPDLQPSGMIDLTRHEDHQALALYLEGVDLIVIDNLSTFCRTGKENEAESWLPVQGWALQQRAAGRSVLFIHHSGKNGEQRGTSRREDALDTVIALRRPGDYTPEKGCCFEVHFEKARGIFGDEVKPFEAQLTTTGDRQEWLTRTLEQSTVEKVAAFLNEGLSQIEIVEELGISKGTVSKAKKKAGALGLLKVVS